MQGVGDARRGDHCLECGLSWLRRCAAWCAAFMLLLPSAASSREPRLQILEPGWINEGVVVLPSPWSVAWGDDGSFAYAATQGAGGTFSTTWVGRNYRHDHGLWRVQLGESPVLLQVDKRAVIDSTGDGEAALRPHPRPASSGRDLPRAVAAGRLATRATSRSFPETSCCCAGRWRNRAGVRNRSVTDEENGDPAQRGGPGCSHPLLMVELCCRQFPWSA